MPGRIQENTELEKPRLWTLNFLLICLSTLTLSLVFHSFNTTLPVYIERFGGSAKIAGLALSSLTAAALISRPITGYCLDRYGRKLIFSVGSCFYVTYSNISTHDSCGYAHCYSFYSRFGLGIGHTSTGTVALDIIPGKGLEKAWVFTV